MYTPSDAWIAAQKQYMAPEGFVEISCYIPQLKETLVLSKKDLMSFTHRQTGSLVSGELPKNHIEFSLDNTDGRWKPNNPQGLERYLSERLRVTLRYGFNIGGATEWIPGGVFYLTEWRTSQNGLEADFVARDLLEYMIDTPYTGTISGTLYDVALSAIDTLDIPVSGAKLGELVLGEALLGGFEISEELAKYDVSNIQYDGKSTVAEVLQKCANAAGCVMYQGRDGVFRITKVDYENTGYTVARKFSYSFPEIGFSRPMKGVSVTYYDNQVAHYHFADTGETQTLNNDYIATQAQALAVAEWICDSLRTRKQVSGEFRGDPRLDLFDVVNVEDKYGMVAGVVLTDIKYTFTGAFRATYSGYVHGSGTAATIYCGECYAGEMD